MQKDKLVMEARMPQHEAYAKMSAIREGTLEELISYDVHSYEVHVSESNQLELDCLIYARDLVSHQILVRLQQKEQHPLVTFALGMLRSTLFFSRFEALAARYAVPGWEQFRFSGVPVSELEEDLKGYEAAIASLRGKPVKPYVHQEGSIAREYDLVGGKEEFISMFTDAYGDDKKESVRLAGSYADFLGNEIFNFSIPSVERLGKLSREEWSLSGDGSRLQQSEGSLEGSYLDEGLHSALQLDNKSNAYTLKISREERA